MRIARGAGEAGFSVAESVVACAILAVGLLGLARLFTLSGTLVAASRDASLASILAAQKLEELRGARMDAPAASHAAVEYLDRRGRAVADAAVTQAAFTRRWSSAPIPPGLAVVFEVVVIPGYAGGSSVAEMQRRTGEVRLLTIQTPQAP